MKIDTVVCEGYELLKAPPMTEVGGSKYKFYGTKANVGFGDELLSKHIAFIGSIGTGKTTAILQVIGQIKRLLTKNDILIVFDSKGEFRQAFGERGDIVVSNEPAPLGDYWNVFEEIDELQLEENIAEISRSLFFEKLRGAKEPFFPNAAKDLLGAVLTLFYKLPELKAVRHNDGLRDFFDEYTPLDLKAILRDEPELRAFTDYLSGGDKMTYGIYSEMQQLVREIFIGKFREKGRLSMRRLVRERGGKTVFIEYDLGIGNTLTPIYRLLFDMAVKEALSRKSRSRGGNVYLICDEFKLVPNLQHIDDAVNFGRGLGLKLVIGVQNVSQIYDIYGQFRADSILSGFSTLVSFRLNDETSRKFVQGAFGQNRKIEAFVPTVHSRGLTESTRVASVVEDWDIARLEVGEAVIGFPGREPFLFRFKNLGA